MFNIFTTQPCFTENLYYIFVTNHQTLPAEPQRIISYHNFR